MYSVEQVINEEITLLQIKQALSKANYHHFNQLIDEALSIIFGENDYDLELLKVFTVGLDDILTTGIFDNPRMNDQYYHVDDIIFNEFEVKGLNDLINHEQPAIDSNYLAVYAIRLSISVLNQQTKNNDLILQVYKEAIEALSAARYSSAYLELCDSHYIEIHRERLIKEHNIKQSNKKKGQARAKQEKIIREKYAKEVYKTAEKVWEIEPLIPVGIMAIAIDEEIEKEYAEKSGYFKMAPNNLALYFRKQSKTPNSAIIKGPPTKQRTNNKHKGWPLSRIAQELVSENIISL